MLSIPCLLIGIKNPFVISMSDLSPDLITRLLDSHRKDYILYRVVERIIENCGSGLLAAHKKSDLKIPLAFSSMMVSRYSAHALLPANGNGDDFFQNRHSEKNDERMAYDKIDNLFLFTLSIQQRTEEVGGGL